MSRAWLARWLGALMAGGVVLSSGCLPTDSLPAPLNVAEGWQAEYVAAGSAVVSALAATDDGRVFYAEKNTGRIRVVKDGRVLGTPFATVPVNYAGDRGLLGLALHPRFADNGRLYVFYTRSDTGEATADPRAVVDHRIVYFQADGDLAAGGETFVASIAAGGTHRIGGRIAFANDRTLWVAMGDGETPEAAQDPDNRYGKVLRYHEDGSIPDDNAYDDSPVYALGFRDPRGLAIDPDSGSAFVVERSQGGTHEVNWIIRGRNYGWPEVVGIADTADELLFVAATPTYVDPLTVTDRQIVGASFNPGTKYGTASWQQLFYGVADAGRVFQLELTAERTGAVRTRTFATGLPTPITDVAFTPAGTLYVAGGGAVLRVVPFP